MIIIKQAKPEDIEAIAGLAEEMDSFYGETTTQPIELRIRQINEAIFSDLPAAHAILAWDGADLTGFASYSFLWPAIGLTRSMYLKELYVATDARRRSIGRLLMRRLFYIASQHDCSRVEWTTDQDNFDAQQFYAELGVSVSASKLFYRVDGDDLREQAWGRGRG